jgi:acyl-CoA thioester hydrolase
MGSESIEFDSDPIDYPCVTTPFSRTFHVRWSDLDFNGHMKNTAYHELAVDVRMMFFVDRGLPVSGLRQLGVGPVVMLDVVEYRREFRMLEPVQVTLALAGISDDGSRFRLCNEFHREDGQFAARLTSTGGWLDLSTRKLVAAPAPVMAALATLARTGDFERLPSSLRAP